MEKLEERFGWVEYRFYKFLVGEGFDGDQIKRGGENRQIGFSALRKVWVDGT